MDTSCNQNKELTYACHCIRDFFSDIDLQHAIQDATALVTAAAGNKRYKNRRGSNLFSFTNSLQQLITAAFIIHNNYYLPPAAMVPPDKATGLPDISKQNNYVQLPGYIAAWAAFPRHLSARQYSNPCRAIKKFTGHCTEPAWQKILKDLLEYAYTNCTAGEEYAAAELLLIRLRLLQLIEACHLLHVRTRPQTKTLKKIASANKKKRS
ncbi:hypothetical protein [Ferruginibacter sp. SUN106]|uniref:hypothetical protein n=1 Tax=Ferruginibacter sp. SUN106 TaxID=2978348 RepID=UPI003D363062